MKAYPVKIDNVSSLGSDEYNDFASGELNNFVQESGQTLSSGNSSQMGVAAANYASHGDYYTDSGAANAYVLTADASKKGINGYIDGSKIRFKVGNANTGASTVNVNTLGVKNIKQEDGTDLSSGQMALDEYVDLVFDSANNYFFLRESGAGASGNISVRTETENYAAVNTDGLIVLDAISGDILLDLFTAVGNVGKQLNLERKDDSFFIKSDDFTDGDVTVGTDNLNINSHQMQALQKIQLSTTGTLPSPLATLTDYWVILIDANNFKLATSLANAIAITPIDITSAAGGGTHTITTTRNIITVDGFGSQLVGSSLTKTLATQGETMKIVSDDSNFRIESREYSKEAIEAGPITIEGSTTDPTKPTVVNTDSFLMTRYANGYDVEYNYYAASGTGGGAGSGVFSFLLPFGLLIPSDRDTANDTANFLYGITLGNGKIGSASSSSYGIAHAFDTSHFGLSSVVANKVDSASFALGLNGIMYRMIMRIPIDGMEG